jgi:hypothetical protein
MAHNHRTKYPSLKSELQNRYAWITTDTAEVFRNKGRLTSLLADPVGSAV